MTTSARTTTSVCLTAAAFLMSSASGFVAFVPKNAAFVSDGSSQLRMGLFDGVKEAFSAPALEKSKLDADRETPIDRWMGWSVSSEDEELQKMGGQTPDNFKDSMDEANYIAIELKKPMGIVFEENDEEVGGIFIQSLKGGGIAANNGNLQPGDQLVAVGETKVSGKVFDDALGTIIDSPDNLTKLVLFRGTADQLYGPTGASEEWLNEFVKLGALAVKELVTAGN